MAIGLERYVLINFTMNCVVIAIIARNQGRNRWPLTLFAAAFGTLYAVAMQYPAFWQLRWWPLRIALGVVMAATAVRMNRPRDLAVNSVLMLGGATFVAGTVSLARNILNGPSVWALAAGAVAGAVGLMTFFAVRVHRIDKWEMVLRLNQGEKSVELSALVDTGNRLQEPISGHPVVIASEHKLRAILPSDFRAGGSLGYLPPGFRLVGYKSLSGSGKLICFRPDELLVSTGDGWFSVPDVWIAVYPGKLPGHVYALAPPVLGRVHNKQ